MEDFDAIVDGQFDGDESNAWVGAWLDGEYASALKTGLVFRIVGIPFHPATYLLCRLINDTGRVQQRLGPVEGFDPIVFWAGVVQSEAFNETCINLVKDGES